MPTNGTTNQQLLATPGPGGSGFPPQSSLAGTPGYPASGPISGATLPYWSYGKGVPTFVAPLGSLYTDINAPTVGSKRFYIYVPVAIGAAIGAAWQVIA